MANDTTTSGYIQPASSPTNDEELDDLLHTAVQQLAGFTDPTLVRPRVQAEPPVQPSFTTDWVAYGIVKTTQDTQGYEVHDPALEGTSAVERTYEHDVLLSFYGPHCAAYLERLRDATQLSQNREALFAQNIGIIEVTDGIFVPALLKERWVRRVDATLRIRRRTRRVYSVPNITSAVLGLDNEHFVTPINTTP